MVKNIYIIRHCKAEGQSSDAPLTNNGFSQAKKLADFLSDKQVDYIVSSPFKRAVQSIKPYAEKRGIEVAVDNRLSERVLSPVPLSDWLEKLEAAFYDLDMRYEGGESGNEAMKRIIAVVDDIVESDSDNAVMVAHGGIISLLLQYYEATYSFEQWKNLSNPDVYLLSLSQGNHLLKRLWEEE